MSEQSEILSRLDQFAALDTVDFLDDPHARFAVGRALESGWRAVAERAVARYHNCAGEVIDQLPDSWWFDRDELCVVVTGFGPFRSHTYNPSWSVARGVAEALEADVSVRATQLRVTHERAEAFIDSLDWSGGQVLALHFGLGGRREQVCFERFAHNCRGQSPDESDETEFLPYLDPAGPAALETRLPLEAMAERYVDQVQETSDVPGVRASRDTGDYVCNTLYYRSLRAAHRTRRAGCAADALFVHVPKLDEPAADRLGGHLGRVFRSSLEAWMG